MTVYMERGKSYLQGPRNILEGRSFSAFGLHAKGCALVPGAKIFLVLGSSKLRDTEVDPRTRKILALFKGCFR